MSDLPFYWEFWLPMWAPAQRRMGIVAPWDEPDSRKRKGGHRHPPLSIAQAKAKRAGGYVPTSWRRA